MFTHELGKLRRSSQLDLKTAASSLNSNSPFLAPSHHRLQTASSVPHQRIPFIERGGPTPFGPSTIYGLEEERMEGKASNICCVHFQRGPCLQKDYLVSTYTVYPGSEVGVWWGGPGSFSLPQWHFSEETRSQVRFWKTHVLLGHIWNKKEYCPLRDPKGCMFSFLVVDGKILTVILHHYME
jgi:hypothetical protein